MKKNLTLIAIIILIIAFARTTAAQNVDGPLKDRSFQAPADARTAGMGGVTQGLSPDANSGWNNIAKLTSLLAEDYTVTSEGLPSISFKPWNGGYLISTSYAHVSKDNEDYFAGFQYFNGGSPYAVGQNLTEQKAYSGVLGHSLALTQDLYFSFAAKLQQLILTNMNISAIAYGGDLSWFYDHKDKHYPSGVGLTIANIGPSFRYNSTGPAMREFMPTAIMVGASQSYISALHNKLTVAVDITRDLYPKRPYTMADSVHYQSLSYGQSILQSNKAISFSIGAEYLFKFHYQNQTEYALRAGFISDDNSEYYSGLTVGGGIVLHNIHIDGAYFISSALKGTGNPPYGNGIQLTISAALKK